MTHLAFTTQGTLNGSHSIQIALPGQYLDSLPMREAKITDNQT